MKHKFNEICEDVSNISNTNIIIFITRITIRIIINYFNPKYSKKIFKLLTGLFPIYSLKKEKSIYYYIIYLIHINKIYLEHLSLYSSEQIIEAVFKKISLVIFKYNYSISKSTKYSASLYISRVVKFNCFNEKSNIKSNLINKDLLTSYNDKNLFYIYGPNSNYAPNKVYNNFNIILTKPLKLKLDNFFKKLLFVNHTYFIKKLNNNANFQDIILEKYDKITISSRELKRKYPQFNYSKFLTNDSTFSLFMLGNILNSLKKESSNNILVIEGFDNYTKDSIYIDEYPSTVKNKNPDQKEVNYCISIIDHDPLFNLILLKDLSKNFNIINSDKFIDIINLAPKEYLEIIQKRRRFKLI